MRHAEGGMTGVLGHIAQKAVAKGRRAPRQKWERIRKIPALLPAHCPGRKRTVAVQPRNGGAQQSGHVWTARGIETDL